MVRGGRKKNMLIVASVPKYLIEKRQLYLSVEWTAMLGNRG